MNVFPQIVFCPYSTLSSSGCVRSVKETSLQWDVEVSFPLHCPSRTSVFAGFLHEARLHQGVGHVDHRVSDISWSYFQNLHHLDSGNRLQSRWLLWWHFTVLSLYLQQNVKVNTFHTFFFIHKKMIKQYVLTLRWKILVKYIVSSF